MRFSGYGLADPEAGPPSGCRRLGVALLVRPCKPADVARICEIYNHFVRETVVTFEEQPVTPAEIAERIRKVTRTLPWLVCEEQGVVAGYAYAAQWHIRSAYRYSVESSIYLAPECCGRGLGAGLYSRLLAELEPLGIHCVIAGIALPNPASVALHEKLGFTKVGHLHDVGFKFGRWIDVGYWERMLRPPAASQ